MSPSPLVVTSLVAAGSRLLWPVRAYPNGNLLNGRRTAFPNFHVWWGWPVEYALGAVTFRRL